MNYIKELEFKKYQDLQNMVLKTKEEVLKKLVGNKNPHRLNVRFVCAPNGTQIHDEQLWYEECYVGRFKLEFKNNVYLYSFIPKQPNFSDCCNRPEINTDKNMMVQNKKYYTYSTLVFIAEENVLKYEVRNIFSHQVLGYVIWDDNTKEYYFEVIVQQRKHQFSHDQLSDLERFIRHYTLEVNGIQDERIRTDSENQ